MIKVAIFASGAGTNADNLIQYFSHHSAIDICLIFCNRKKAGVIEVAKKNNIPIEIVSSKDWKESEVVLSLLQNHDIDYIILAGFLLKVPGYILQAYPEKIINVHPALLPDFGGKGMYGNFVHQAVLDSGKTETGITIHLVNENYDEGQILFQAKTTVEASDDIDSLSKKVHHLEYEHLPKQTERFILASSVPKA